MRNVEIKNQGAWHWQTSAAGGKADYRLIKTTARATGAISEPQSTMRQMTESAALTILMHAAALLADNLAETAHRVVLEYTDEHTARLYVYDNADSERADEVTILSVERYERR